MRSKIDKMLHVGERLFAGKLFPDFCLRHLRRIRPRNSECWENRARANGEREE